MNVSNLKEKYRYFVLSLCSFFPISWVLFTNYFHEKKQQFVCACAHGKVHNLVRESNNDSFLALKVN
jgi:hypothetical protein